LFELYDYEIDRRSLDNQFIFTAAAAASTSHKGGKIIFIPIKIFTMLYRVTIS
jgi:hypothetical protein